MANTFMVVIGDDILRTSRILGILQSYSILNAYMVYANHMPYIMDDIGTVIHIEKREKILAVLHTIPSSIRYIGLVEGTEEIISLPTAIGYIAIPVPIQEKECPYVTLAPPMQIVDMNHTFKNLLGKPVEYEWSNPVRTKSVIAHPAWIKGEEYPKRADIEMEGIKSNSYETSVGFPVII
jgi:hypothetical protein